MYVVCMIKRRIFLASLVGLLEDVCVTFSFSLYLFILSMGDNKANKTTNKRLQIKAPNLHLLNEFIHTQKKRHA